MSGTVKKLLTLVYLNGDVERLEVWDWDCDPEEFGLNPDWVENWDNQNYEVFGLDPEVNAYMAVNLAALRRMSVAPIEPEDMVPAPPIEPSSYTARGFLVGTATKIPSR